jgi:DNA-binding transcriptional ArsR family regulator
MRETSIPGFAGRLAALSQPTRLKIVEVVAQSRAAGVAAGEIARALRCPASTLSFHLKELSQCGLLEATPDGRFIRYSLKPDAFAELAAFISGLAGAPATGKVGELTRKQRGKKTAKRSPGKGERDASDARREGQLSIFDE